MRRAGVRVRVHRLFWLGRVFVAGRGRTSLPLWLGEASLALVVGELAHVLGWRFSGLRPRVLFYGLGAETSATVTRRLSTAQCLVVLLAGPAADGMLALAARALGLHELAEVCLGWGMLQLLPLYPLSGGRVLATF